MSENKGRSSEFRMVTPIGGVRDEDGKAILYGHFARFNEWTEISSAFEGHFMERVAPGAFKKTFQEQTPKVLLNHGNDTVLGKSPLGKIRELREDDEGAYYEVELFRGLPEYVVDGLTAGEYGASFRFEVMREDVDKYPERSDHNPSGIKERTLAEVRVPEFGPVTFPAYKGATAQAGMRSITDFVREDEHLDYLARLTAQPELLRGLLEKLERASERDQETQDDPSDAVPEAGEQPEHLEREQDALPEGTPAVETATSQQGRRGNDKRPLYGMKREDRQPWRIG